MRSSSVRARGSLVQEQGHLLAPGRERGETQERKVQKQQKHDAKPVLRDANSNTKMKRKVLLGKGTKGVDGSSIVSVKHREECVVDHRRGRGKTRT